MPKHGEAAKDLLETIRYCDTETLAFRKQLMKLAKDAITEAYKNGKEDGIKLMEDMLERYDAE